MALAKCPVYVDGPTCGQDFVEENPPDGKFTKIYICARGHIPYCVPADSFYPGNKTRQRLQPHRLFGLCSSVTTR